MAKRGQQALPVHRVCKALSDRTAPKVIRGHRAYRARQERKALPVQPVLKDCKDLPVRREWRDLWA